MIKEEYIMLFIHRFNVLRDKINFGIKLNDLDKKLLDILDEYDFYIEDIKEENRKRVDKK